MSKVTVQHEKWSEAGRIAETADALCETIRGDVISLLESTTGSAATDKYDIRKRIESIVEDDPAAAFAVYGMRILREGDSSPLFECPKDANLLSECGNTKSWRRSYRTRYSQPYTPQYQSPAYSSTRNTGSMCGTQQMVEMSGSDDYEGESLEQYFERLGLLDQR